MDCVSVIWSNCDKHCLDRVLKLQKRAARIVTGADSYAPSVQVFNMLEWIPFFENAILAKCCIMYKRLQNRVPSYLTNLLVLTSETHSRPKIQGAISLTVSSYHIVFLKAHIWVPCYLLSILASYSM